MLRLLRSAAAPLLPAVLRLLVGSAVLGAAVPAASQSTVPATLVQIIDAARWATPSADPSGIGYWPARGTYLVSDGEIDEVSFFAGVNLYEMTPDGLLIATYTTLPFSSEPVGMAVNPSNGHLFISDDDKRAVFEVSLGPDGVPGTDDDAVRSFSTRTFGSADPEGLAFGAGRLFVSDGLGHRVYVIDPGPNGVFEGTGDDVVTSFDTAPFGVQDPEGIEYEASTGTLYVVAKGSPVVQTTIDGTFIRAVDVSALQIRSAAGLALGPGSAGGPAPSLFIADRNLDNDQHPDENDGRIFEITFPALDPAPPSELTATAGAQTEIALAWRNNAANPDGTAIERCQGASCTTFGEIDRVGLGVSAYTSTGLTPSTSYRYRVRAFRGTTVSAPSNIAAATTLGPPFAPSGLQAATTADGIALAWTDNATNETGFSVERCDGPGCTTFGPIGTAGVNATAFTDPDVVAGVSYSYRVLAVNAQGVSAYSNVATVVAASWARLTPVADAYVRADKPSSNYGTAATVSLASTPERIAYVRFNLAALAGAPVTAATLRLRITTDDSPGPNSVRVVENTTWSETSINYNNRPPVGGGLATFANTPPGIWLEIDLTAIVAARAGGLLSLAIDSATPNSLSFVSREGASADRPQLVVRQ